MCRRMAPSSATPLGASGATLPQADHGTHSRRAGREGLATGLEGANEAAAAASRDGSGHALGSQTPEAGFTGLGNTMKRMLGEHQWQHAQSRIKLQAQEFDLQASPCPCLSPASEVPTTLFYTLHHSWSSGLQRRSAIFESIKILMQALTGLICKLMSRSLSHRQDT